jgi:hypothetical protein
MHGEDEAKIARDADERLDQAFELDWVVDVGRPVQCHKAEAIARRCEESRAGARILERRLPDGGHRRIFPKPYAKQHRGMPSSDFGKPFWIGSVGQM